MSYKSTNDRDKPNWPWTARQRRQKKMRRLARKQVRHLRSEK